MKPSPDKHKLRRLTAEFDRILDEAKQRPDWNPLAQLQFLHRMASLHGFDELAQAVVRESAELYSRSGASEAATDLKRRMESVRSDQNSGIELGGLAPLERELVCLLREAAMTKFELVEKLYGDQVSFLHAERRLKNLISRVRSKFPRQVQRSGDRYRFIS